jgi:hypothetical protein
MTSRMPPSDGEIAAASALDEQRASTDVEDSSDESEDNDPRWPTVKNKRAGSLDSARTRLKNKKHVYLKSKTLSTEQERMVEFTTGLLNQEQKD